MKFSEALFSRASQTFSFQEGTLKLPLHPHHVVVKPLWVGICGSDLVALELNMAETLVLGHEWIGEVVETGEAVTTLKAGDRVTSANLIRCGYCPGCTGGDSECTNLFFLSSNNGMLKTVADFPAAALIKLDGAVSPATTLFEILAVGENVYSKLKDVLSPEKNVLIIGAGPLGLSVALVLRHYGLNFLMTETIPSRVQRARNLRLNVISNGQLYIDTSHRNKYDLIIDCSGDHLQGKGAWAMFEVFGKHAFTVAVLAKYIQDVNIRPMTYFLKNAELRWIQGCTNESLKSAIRNFQSTIEELGSHMISHVFDFAETNAAFSAARDRNQSGRVVIKVQAPSR